MPKRRTTSLASRGPLEESKFDREYGQAIAVARRAIEKVQSTVMDCILQAAMAVAPAAREYSRDLPHLGELAAAVVSALQTRDLIGIAEATRRYCEIAKSEETIDFSSSESREVVRSNFYVAALNLHNAIDKWAENTLRSLDDAHADTVRCRASLNKIYP